MEWDGDVADPAEWTGDGPADAGSDEVWSGVDESRGWLGVSPEVCLVMLGGGALAGGPSSTFRCAAGDSV